LLDLVAEVMAHPVKLDAPPRMADAAEIMAALDARRKTKALASYEHARAEITEKVLESDVVAAAVLEFMDGQNEWTGKSADLYEALEQYAPPFRRGWPGNARVLSQRLNRAIPQLESARGLIAERRVRGGIRLIHLRWA
jgi:hypothetical protein